MSKDRSTQAFEKQLTMLDRSVFETFATFAEAEEADRTYWRSRTPIERLIALEHIRQLAWGYNDETRPKLSGSPGLLKLRQRKVPGAGRVRGKLLRVAS
jgi:hypothetical protein